MKFPTNGSLFANLLLLSGGIVLGATGYWTAENVVLSDSYDEERRLKNWSDEQPEANTVRGLSSIGQSNDYGKLEQSLAEAPAVTIGRAERTDDPRLRSEMLRRAGAEGARRDLEEALKIGHSLRRHQDRLDYFRGLFGVWAEGDPESALAYAKQTFTTGLMQTEMISLVVNKWGSENPQKARLWTEQNMSGPAREQALTDLMIGWTRRNPGLAADWVTTSGLGTQPMMAAVGSTWAERDPEAAAIWAQGIVNSSARRAATLAVANEFSRQDPEGAAVAFEDALNEGGSEALNLATVIADVWATTDPSATAAWVTSLPDGEVRDQAAGVLATVWAGRDIDSAVAWTATIQDADMRQQIIAHLSTTWGAIEPDRAVAWLATLDASEAQAGIVGAFNSWGAVDPEGMRDWIENSDTSSISDFARRSLADVVSQDDVLTAIDLALGIGQATEREESVARYFRHWRKIDDASAQEWLLLVWNDLTPDVQERLERERKARIPGR